MSVCLHWARQEEGTLQSLGEEPVGGPFPPAPCRCLTLRIGSHNNWRRKWTQQPREPFPLRSCSSPSATWTCSWPARNAGSSWGTSTALSATVSDAKPRTRYVAWKQIETLHGGVWEVFRGPLLLVTLLQRALGSRTEGEPHSISWDLGLLPRWDLRSLGLSVSWEWRCYPRGIKHVIKRKWKARGLWEHTVRGWIMLWLITVIAER